MQKIPQDQVIIIISLRLYSISPDFLTPGKSKTRADLIAAWYKILEKFHSLTDFLSPDLRKWQKKKNPSLDKDHEMGFYKFLKLR